MALQAIQLFFPSEVIDTLSSSYQKSIEIIKEASVLELYREGRISAGKAAEILGMDRFEFVAYSGMKGIPFIRITPEELEQDVKRLEELL